MNKTDRQLIGAFRRVGFRMKVLASVFRWNLVLVAFVALFLSSSQMVRSQEPWSFQDVKIIHGHEAAEYYKEGEVLVRFRPGITRPAALQSVAPMGEVLRYFEKVGVYHVRLKEGVSVRQAVSTLKEDARVLYAEPNYRWEALEDPLSKSTLPNDPRFEDLWGLHNTGQRGTPDADIDAPEAWDWATGSHDVVVGVIDTGVDYTHEDLAANMWVNQAELGGTPGVDDDGNGYVDDVYGIDTAYDDSDPMDGAGHGTHVAGTIGAVGDNGVGVVGVNWQVRIMALKFLNDGGGGYTDDAIETLNYAITMKENYGVNLKLTSNSWGGGSYSQALYDAIAASGDAGMLFVAAAGNDRMDTDDTPHYPSSYDVPNIISVAATDYDDQMASFSNWGTSSVDVAAPGVDILSTTPGDSYSYGGGTSMATPHVSGLAALIASAHPGYMAMQTKNLILNTVDELPALEGKILTEGRINAHGAFTCDDSVLKLWVTSPSPGFEAPAQWDNEIEVSLGHCAELVTDGTAVVSFSSGEADLPLSHVGEGIYRGAWRPTVLGDVTLTIRGSAAGYAAVERQVSGVAFNLPSYVVEEVAYDWVELSDSGTAFGLALGDDNVLIVQLPFDLTFYNLSRREMTIGSNGQVNFEGYYLGLNNAPIPSRNFYEIEQLVAPFWDDLIGRTYADEGMVYIGIQGEAPSRQLVVEWKDVGSYYVGGAATFEVIFYEDNGDILMQYQDVEFGSTGYDYGASATVGIQYAINHGTQFSYNSPALHNQMALRFSYSSAAQTSIPAAAIQDGSSETFGKGYVPWSAQGGAKLSWLETGRKPESQEAAEYQEGELLLRLKPGLDAVSAAEAVETVGEVVRYFEKVDIYHIQLKVGVSAQQAVSTLKEDARVLYAEPNYRWEALEDPLSKSTLPNDPRFEDLWGLHNTGQRGTPDADIDAPEAWDWATGSHDVVVGVIDTGVDYTHEDLAANMWVNQAELGGTPGVDDDGNGYVDDVYGIDTAYDDSDPMDGAGHGTHVAGTIGAVGDNGVGVVGVNWQVRIMALKFLSDGGGGWTDDAIETLNYAITMKEDYGVNLKLTSNSWGGGSYSQALYDAIAASGDAGMLFVAAAGNDRMDTDVMAHYPSSYDLANIISVAATDYDDQMASFSNWGVLSVDVAAPGVSILSTTPGNNYSYMSGTSMAAPHVSGLAALIASANPGYTAMQTKNLILNTVDELSALQGKILTEGRINAYGAFTCDDSVLKLWVLSPSPGFEAPAQWDNEIEVSLGHCAELVTDGTAVVSFSSGEADLPLSHVGEGIYRGAWRPTVLGDVTLTIRGSAAGYAAVERQVSGVAFNLPSYVVEEVAYDWMELSGSGSAFGLALGRNTVLNVALPFALTFYNRPREEIAIGSNGQVNFEGYYLGLNNAPIPSQNSYEIEQLLAPLWDYLIGRPYGDEGMVYIGIQGEAPNRQLVIEWKDVGSYYVGGAATFEVIFYEGSGDILMQYKDVGFGDSGYDYGASATVGIQYAVNHGTQFSYNSPTLHNQMALRFQPSPVTLVSPANGEAMEDPALTFTWNPVAGAVNYRIQIDTLDTFDSPNLIEATVASTQYMTILSLGTWYWHVLAIDGAGNESAYSPTWRFTIAEPVVQVTTDPGSDYEPSIVQAADGTLWVAWHSYRSGNGDIWNKASNDSGATWSAPIQITTNTSSDYAPSITQAADGTLWVLWYSYRSGNADIWYKTSSDGGATWSAATQLTTDTGSDYEPAIAQAADGKLWVVWRSYRSGNSDIWGKYSTDDGATWSAAVQLTTDPNSDYAPAIARTSDNRLWLVWYSYRTHPSHVWYMTSADNGATWSPPAALGNDSSYVYDPTIAQTPDGTLWVGWHSYGPWDPHAYYSLNTDLWTIHSTDGGATWSVPARFTRFTGYDERPSFAAGPGGTLAVAWQSDRATNYDVWFGVMGQREDVNPPPHIDEAVHDPAPNPDNTQTVTIRALLSDNDGIASATVIWTRDGVAQPDLTLYDDGAHDDYSAGDGWYGAQLAPFPAGTVVDYHLRLQDTSGNVVEGEPINWRYPTYFVVQPQFVPMASLLLVADDRYRDPDWFSGFYTNALDALSHEYDLWNTYVRGVPDSATLAHYDAVIWAMADYGMLGSWPEKDVATANLQSYLDAGGKLFISGQNVAYYTQWGSSFLQDYLHASYVQDDPGLRSLTGVAGDPIGDGLTLGISGGDGANNQWFPDEIDPISPAVTVFTYDTTAVMALAEPIRLRPEMAEPKWENGKPGATLIPVPRGGPQEPLKKLVEAEPAASVQDIVSSGTGGLRVDTGAYKVVFFSFGFEAINNAGDRTVVMERVLNWLIDVTPPPGICCVRTTNVRDISFTVSWVTNVEADGEVHYGTDPANLNQTAYDDRGTGTSDDTHYVTLQGLTPETTYYFDVVSAPTTDDNHGAHYSVTTGPTLGLPPSDTIYGQVFKEDETTLAEGSIVYITLRDTDGSGSLGEAAPLSALVDATGYWNTNLGNARMADLNAYFTYSASGDQVKLEAQGAADGTGCLLVDTANDDPAADLILNVSTCSTEVEIPVQVGWNHISLPLEPLTPYTAEDACREINDQGGDAIEIDRWYAGGWDGHICGLPFNDFPVELGSDYFIKSNAVSTWTICGYPVLVGAPLDLQTGWNSIGVPHSDAYTAESLCDEIISQGVTAVEIDRWYAGGWDGHICGLPFNDFPIEIGKGYFVKAGSSGTVTPSFAALPSVGASPLAMPKPAEALRAARKAKSAIAEVRATNVRDTSFTVSWSTDVMATGWANYGASTALGQTAYDDRGANAIGKNHHVTIHGLSPQTTYYFEVVSGATVDDHEDSYYQATTGPTLELPASDSIYGRVFEEDGLTPAEGVIVYVILRDADGVGDPGEAGVMSALVDSEGWWHANLGNARLADGSNVFAYSAAGDVVTLAAQGAGVGLVTQTIDTGDLRPAAPLISRPAISKPISR